MTGATRWRDTTAEASAAVLAAVIEHAGLGIALVGLDGVAFQANPAFCRMVGYRENELLGMTFAEYTHPDDAAADEAVFHDLVAGRREVYRLEKRYIRKNGETVWGALTVSAVRGSNGRLLFAVGMVEDVTQQRQLREKLEHQALHDHLTELPNRRLFEDRLQHAVELAARQNHRLAVIMLDLDDFKAINDVWGHPVGDEVLKSVAQRLAGACRDSDTVARLGGDEFAVLCEGHDSADHAAGLADRLRAAMAKPVVLASGATLQTSASVGFTTTDTPDDYAGLLRRADAAMYGHKSSARAVTTLQQALHSRVTLEQAKGVLAESGDLDMDTAVDTLRRYAEYRNVDPAEVAHGLISRTLSSSVVLEHMRTLDGAV